MINLPYKKYPKTKHVSWSRTIGEDDKVHSSMEQFHGREVLVSEKLDGENTNCYKNYYHARSIDSKHHPSRDWIKTFISSFQHNIPEGWRVCGENMYAKHSIFYDNLESYFYGFSVWNDKNVCLSWDDTIEWFELLGIVPVPVLYRGIYNENIIKKLYDPCKNMEGYVIRVADEVRYEDFSKYFAKFVREKHVQTDEHWMHSEIVPNKLKEQ
jgi:hypothetical protein